MKASAPASSKWTLTNPLAGFWNQWTSGGTAGPGNAPPPATLSTHEAFLQIGGELIAVAITAVFAASGPRAGHAMVALWVLLWLIFLLNHYA